MAEMPSESLHLIAIAYNKRSTMRCSRHRKENFSSTSIRPKKYTCVVRRSSTRRQGASSRTWPV